MRSCPVDPSFILKVNVHGKFTQDQKNDYAETKFRPFTGPAPTLRLLRRSGFFIADQKRCTAKKICFDYLSAMIKLLRKTCNVESISYGRS